MSSGQTKVVAFGGGHGLAATLTALRDVTPEITAIVTVADNGGSSGKIRDEFNFLPPGDLRMALAALCSADSWGQNWAQIIQHRFTSAGPLNGHALGNLLMAALWDSSDDLVAGIDRVGELLKIVGRVLPMSLDPLDIEGVFTIGGGEAVIRGQIEVATAKGKIAFTSITSTKSESYTTGFASNIWGGLVDLWSGLMVFQCYATFFAARFS